MRASDTFYLTLLNGKVALQQLVVSGTVSNEKCDCVEVETHMVVIKIQDPA